MNSPSLPCAIRRAGALSVCLFGMVRITAAPGSTGTWEPGTANAAYGRVELFWPLVLGLGLTALSQISRRRSKSSGDGGNSGRFPGSSRPDRNVNGAM
jgi:hypothetical protein